MRFKNYSLAKTCFENYTLHNGRSNLCKKHLGLLIVFFNFRTTVTGVIGARAVNVLGHVAEVFFTRKDTV